MKKLIKISKLLIFGACFLTVQPIVAQQIQQEEKKTAAEQDVLLPIVAEPAATVQTAQRPVSLSNSIMTYLTLHGAAAAQRVRGLVSGPAMHRRAHDLGCTLLSAGGCAGIYGGPQLPTRFEAQVLGAGSICLLFGALAFPCAKRYSTNENFFRAIRIGNINTVRYVLATGFINANADNLGINFWVNRGNLPEERPLNVAAQYGQAAIAQLLLDNGADITAQDRDGKTVEDYLQIQPNDPEALKQGKRAVTKVILEYKLQQSAQRQRTLRSVHGPVEAVAAAALEALHRRLYGNVDLGLPEDISRIVIGYLSPTYVRPERKTQMIRVAPRKAEVEEKKKSEDSELQEIVIENLNP